VMKNEMVMLIAEDDEGHATLIKKQLARSGILNQMIHFKDGDETLDFLLRRGKGPHRESGSHYLLLLDIRMPRVDGIEVLSQVKGHDELRKMPVIMITTTDDPREVDRCHALGCSHYITKSVDYDMFVNAIRQLALFLPVVKVPKINGELYDEIPIKG
jgi:CheY-like chemotaxis protein